MSVGNTTMLHRMFGWITFFGGISALIALTEVDRIIGRCSVSGTHSTIAAIVGPGAWGNRSGWDSWTDLGSTMVPGTATMANLGDGVAGLIGFHTLFDAVFFVCYGYLLYRLILLFAPRGTGGTNRIALGFLAALVAAEVVEAILLIAAAVGVSGGSVPGTLRSAIAIVALLKWATVIALAVTIGRNTDLRGHVQTWCRTWYPPVWVQRLSVLTAALLGVLTLPPIPGALDQIPDAQRRVLDEGPRYYWFLPFLFALIAVALYVIGSWRAKLAAEKETDENAGLTARALLWPWLVPPIVVAIAGVWLFATGYSSLVDGTSFWIFIGAFVVTVVVSAALRLLRREPEGTDADGDATEPPPPITGRQVQVVGNVSVILVLAVAIIGLIRAFTAPVVVGITGPEPLVWKQVAVLIAGWLLVGVGSVVVAVFWDRLIDLAVFVTKPAFFRTSVALLMVVGSGFVLAYVVWPAHASEFFGVMGTVTIGIGVWPILLGAIIIGLQFRRPPEIFAFFRMEAAPVLSLTAILLVAVGWAGGDPDLHAVKTRPGSADSPSDRTDVAAAFTSWADRTDGCPGTVRPLVIVAASGGGIRAAVWTASAMASITQASDDADDAQQNCRSAVFASSGVSGGSVGLALTRAEAYTRFGNNTPTARQSIDAARAIRQAGANLADPDVIAAGLAGTVIGDPVASGTGIRAQLENSGPQWSDRAALIEQGWATQVPPLGETFPWTAAGSPTGPLILNSTSVGPHCRVLVSQLQTGVTIPAPPSDAEVGRENTDDPDTVGCSSADGQPAAAVDFADLFAPCLPTMSWATAAMLSARFPYVTPSGRVSASSGPCEGNAWQFIDGGYADGSGLATVADLAPQVSVLAAEHNARVSAGDARGYIVPIVVYLDDEPQDPASAENPKATVETLVPVTGYLNTHAALAGTAASMQRISNALALACSRPSAPGQSPTTQLPVDTACDDARRELLAQVKGPLGATLSGSVITAAPPLLPNVEVPLGWTLSEASVRQLQNAAGTGALCGADGSRSPGLSALKALVCQSVG